MLSIEHQLEEFLSFLASLCYHPIHQAKVYELARRLKRAFASGGAQHLEHRYTTVATC